MEKITKSSDTVLIDPNEPLILPDGTALVGRVEWFLYALCCLDYQNLPTPMSRIEEFANALITGEIPNIEPQSRAEQFFLAILDGNVSNLPQPQSRSEVLLDKLARGEFDLSDVEPIQSSYELLLAYLIKNGGIDNIDYVLYEFSEAMKTMYNTVEKPFKSLELSGNTLVNCVLEDTENDDYTSFDKDYSGTSFTINGTSEGAIKSAILKGQTLVNIATKHEGGYDVGGEVIMTPTLLKANTKYYIKVIDDEFNLNRASFRTKDWTDRWYYATNGVVILTTPSQDEFNNYMYLTFNVIKNGETVEINNTIRDRLKWIICEYQEDMENWDIPHFEGMQSVKMPVLTTTGKNLFDINHFSKIKNWDRNITAERPYDSYKIKLKPNTSYTFSRKENSKGSNVYFCISKNKGVFDIEGGIVHPSSAYANNKIKKVTTDASGILYFNLYLANSELANLIPLLEEAQFEENSNATSYEPFKSNILSCNEEVELRGVGDVKDELNLITGELTNRIGTAIIDGTNIKATKATKDGNTYRFDINLTGIKNYKNHWVDASDVIVSDNFIGFTPIDSTINSGNRLSLWGSQLVAYFNDTSITTISQANEYLQNNISTIQYHLATESVKTVDLNVVDQNNTKIDKMHVFNEVTHVNTSSDELTPTVNIGKSVSYPTIIKSNTKYTVDLKRNDKPLTVNLGGTEVTFANGETRKVITTPSTLINDKLSCYGIGAKCNEIMLIEGEVEGNVDYFTGMQSVVMQNQMPILSTVGKNLLPLGDGQDMSSTRGVTFTQKDGKLLINGTATDTADYRVFNHNNNVEQMKKFNSLPVGTTLTMSNNLGKDCYFNVIRNGSSIYLNKTITIQDGDKDINAFVRINRGETYNNTELNIQIEEGTSATAYEPYKTSILSCNEDVMLRGIGDVKDELNCLTGEVTERIGEIVLNGSENWVSFDMYNVDGYSTFVATIPTLNNLHNNDVISIINDKFASTSWGGYLANRENETIWSHDPNKIGIRVKSEKASNVEEIKEFLSTNNIRINYTIATESIKTVDLNVVDQDGNTIPKIKSYNDVTHLKVTVPKQSLLPNVSAEVATDNSKDMSVLTTKHQEISETQSAIQDNIQSQSDEIDTALMATTEIFESILE